MNETPRGNRLHIALFGRVNAGKSTVMNLLAGQDIALTSPQPGTTTDLVEKAMELLPLGPVLLIDTAGLGDATTLGDARATRTARALHRADLALLVVESGVWTHHEEEIVVACAAKKVPVIGVINKIDVAPPTDSFAENVRRKVQATMTLSAIQTPRDSVLIALKDAIAKAMPRERTQPPLVADLLPPGGVALLVVPIDLQAPKGRLILPQVQTIRETLDVDATAIVVKERELAHTLRLLKQPPDLVISDSQAILKVDADVPRPIPLTTFSILFARQKGDLAECARGAAAIGGLKPGDSVLIAEGCTHHALEDDIGRVKIPRWLRQRVGGDLDISHVSGCTFPPMLVEFDLVIHCGACTLNRTEMLHRIAQAKQTQTPITNYGVAISYLQGVLPRVLAPFPAALRAFEGERRVA
jgi:[FeFe] hydrogenase H-cluster maturation GTPase HydF